MKYESTVYQMTVEDHTFWVAESKALKGCLGQGDTSEEAIKELEVNENEWLETAKDVGIPIPEITSYTPLAHSGKVALRLAPNVHEEALNLATKMGISLNHYLSDAVSSYNATTKAALYKPANEGIPGKVISFPVGHHTHGAPKLDEITDLEEM